jgi:hypothetical protein
LLRENFKPSHGSRDKAKQEETVILYIEQDYTNAIDNDDSGFLTPLLAETRKYRMLHFEPRQRFDYEFLVTNNYAFFREAVEIPVDQASEPASKRQKVLTAKSRVFFRNSELSGRLPLGSLELYSIVGGSYSLALTKGHTASALNNLLSADPGKDKTEILGREGGYVDLDSDGNWWVPSAQQFFATSPGQNELKEAREGFYIPVLDVDPFGFRNTVQFDRYRLLHSQTVDSVGNTIVFSNNYVSLKPTLTTDPNENRTQVVFDCLGRPTGMAVMGKEGENVGDNLDSFQPVVTEEQLKAFMKDPVGQAANLLLGAGKRKLYGTDWYWLSKTAGASATPSFEVEISRDIHVSAPNAKEAHISIHITYLDGYGGTTQETILQDLSPVQRWLVSGWVLHDNKRQPVQEFLPLYTTSHEYRFRSPALLEAEPATTILRDPIGRVVGSLSPDHTWTKTVFTPWSSQDFNAGDTVLTVDPSKDEDIGGTIPCAGFVVVSPNLANDQICQYG